MKKSEFLKIIHHYNTVSDEELSELKVLQNEYPYSQVIHNLVAKASIDKKKSDAKASLSVAAVYATDRAVLKKLIDNQVKFTEKEVRLKPSDGESMKATQSSFSETEKIKSKDFELDVFKLKPSKDRAAIERLRKEVMDNLSLLLKYKEETKHWFNGKSKKTEKKTIAKSKTKKSTKKEGISLIKTDPKVVKPEKRSTKRKTNKAEQVKKKTAKAKTKALKAKSSIKSIQKKSESTSKKKSKAKPKSLIDEIKSGPKKKVALRKEQKDQQNIIDHFINSESEIIIDPKKSAKEPQADLAKDSGHLEEELISENLAMIFEKQGKPVKAIEIYKKLIWKFPQKKAYFASQIEKLKKG